MEDPKLSRLERLGQRFRPPRRVLPTRAGMITLGAPLLLGVAAINSSNNLLFLLVGACLGLITLSGMISEKLMRVVSVRVSPAGPIRAGEPARLIVTAQRPPSSSPLFDLRIRERVRRRLSKRIPLAERLDARIPLLDGASGSVIAERVFPRRGLDALRPLELQTRYPFALLTKACDLDATCEVLVRPRGVAVPGELEDPRGLAEHGQSANQRGAGDDFYGLRDRDERDLEARVHALRSLRLGYDVVVETEATRRPVAWIGIAGGQGVDVEAFERALEVAQAVLEQWHSRGWAVGLRLSGVELSSDRVAIGSVLDLLATATSEGDAPELDEGAVWLVPRGAAARDAGARSVFDLDATGALSLRAWRAAA